jgi:LacI family repressor for deo operon, udp, cdd, tsx, nupC, and nupG
MTQKASIVDVAERAGVSVATVSRALRNHQYVAESTRARVLEAAQALHYVADANASRLASGRSHTIGLLAPILTSWYTSEIIVGVEEVLSEVGLDLLISTQGLPHERNEFTLATAFHQRVDGVILVDAFVYESGARELVKASTPAVALGEKVDAVPSLCIDNELGGELATRHLLELGHRRIGLMRGPNARDILSAVPHQRTAGYRAALASQRIKVDKSLIVDGGFTIEGGRRAARALLSAANPPTAVFCMSDEMAFGVLQACREMGISVPEDFSVIGFDDHSVSEAVGLSTIRQSVRQMGNLAARLIADVIAGHEPMAGHHPQGIALIQRATTGPARKA